MVNDFGILTVGRGRGLDGLCSRVSDGWSRRVLNDWSDRGGHGGRCIAVGCSITATSLAGFKVGVDGFCCHTYSHV